MYGVSVGRMLAAGAVIALLGLGLLPAKELDPGVANIVLETDGDQLTRGETFVVSVNLSATEAVNVFKGILHFDPDILSIESIDYNISVADLWAEEPWYSNGDGTLTFVGGTLNRDGFTGEETIIKVTFRADAVGETSLTVTDMRIIKHDGLGTDALLGTPVDSIFTISEEELAPLTVANKTDSKGPELNIISDQTSTDLNNDGKQSLADVSIFMAHLATQNLRSDFNEDGKVNLQDLSILNH